MKLLLLNINGHGPFNGTLCKSPLVLAFRFTHTTRVPGQTVSHNPHWHTYRYRIFPDDTVANVRIIGRTVDRDGGKYVKIDTILLKAKVGGARYHMENLFNGDPTLGAVGNEFVNANSKLFLDEMIPYIEKSLAKIFLEIVDVVLKDVQFDEMFPDTPAPE